jgi:hypothetical protein
MLLRQWALCLAFVCTIKFIDPSTAHPNSKAFLQNNFGSCPRPFFITATAILGQTKALARSLGSQGFAQICCIEKHQVQTNIQNNAKLLQCLADLTARTRRI